MVAKPAVSSLALERSAPTADDDRRLLRAASVALAAAVWVLGLVPPPARLGPAYVIQLTLAVGLLVAVELTAPGTQAPPFRRAVWLLLELGLAFGVVRTQTSLIRLSLIYLLPASRALLMFGARLGLVASLAVWVVYGANVALSLLPAKAAEFPNYFSFLLAPYVLAVVLTMAVMRQARDRERLAALYFELREAHEELQVLHYQAQEAAVNRERNRLAREIHDSVAHYLTVVNLQLEAVDKLVGEQPERAVEQARLARKLTVECLQEVRRSVAALRSATLEELALPGALKKLAAEFSESTGLKVELDIEADKLALPADASMALYRTAQEGLTNVHRHAQARLARIVLSRQNGQVELAVEDDGQGPAANGSGFGLLGLRERLELVGGELGFSARPGGGCRLSARVPVREPGA